MSEVDDHPYLEPAPLQKRPVAFRVGPFNGGWALYNSEEAANKHAEGFWDHAVSVQGLYVRDGT